MPDPFVKPIGDELLAAIDDTLRAAGHPSSGDIAKMGPLLSALSAAYNDPTPAGLASLGATSLAPRLAFSFARDVPKYAGAVRELVRSGLLEVSPEKPLRILDVGAGLGASTFGIAHALRLAGGSGVIEATWFDVDTKAMALGATLARRVRERAKPGDVTVHVTVESGGVAAALAHPGLDYDLVVLGQMISELDRAADAATRAPKHAALVRTLLERKVAPAGSLVVVEPALRDRTRHLHAIREALRSDVTIFAPCLHSAACPMMASEEDWCHEDLDVDLPAALVPLARAAGLRFQGLTFSYLVLRRDDVSLASRARAPLASSASAESSSSTRALRMVSMPFVTKGKREAVFCGERAIEGGGLEAGRVRVRLLDREVTDANLAFTDATRGDLICFAPDLAGVAVRLGRDTVVTLASLGDR